ncbi:5-methylcytosine-specific restriction protein B [Luteimonas sp. J16]|uniref:AAA family ATPase n=1 Tax=unclassified Luteimonas TaxID=2629088 RepID=UPI0011ADFC18|nr:MULTISPECIES: AAA family ATPase [unclassified Luteimonas]TWG94594.1 5-methylcytosine-specific restriction protein B [Luteimonas sp. J16]
MVDITKPQWEQAADAVAELGGQANRYEVWEHLKKFRPDIPFSTVTADLNAVSVNAPSRASYHTGKEPRRTDSGHRYDRLFKVGVGEGSYYVTYDPAIHGVWEIYPDPFATSTNKTAIRQVGKPSFNAAIATQWLEARYPGTRSGTSHITAFRNVAGRALAFDPGPNPSAKTNLMVFVSRQPPPDLSGNVEPYPPEKNRNHHLAAHAKSLAKGHAAYAVGVSSIAQLQSLCDWYDASVPDHRRQPGEHVQVPQSTPTNKILFGPPGTGKTYHTINETLALLDPEFLRRNAADRGKLKARFDELAHSGQVRFVTFHQSFSYEDFIEGIRAKAEDGEIRYEVEDGVFKELCEAARSRTTAATGSPVDISGRRIWKVSLGDAQAEGHVYEACMSGGYALLGFGAGADLTGVGSRAEILDRVKALKPDIDNSSYDITALNLFIREMRKGDLIVVTHGNLKFRAIGEVTGEYQFLTRDDVGTYVQARPVNWLRRYDPPRPYADLMENRFSQMTIYELRPGSINLDRLSSLLAPEEAGSGEPQPRVLIIDEINRGNVSRIFGEVITLIEPSKRAGCPEALEVTLPYSKDRFSVPANVHLIGTMNTADRSLAGLDVALRRRFEFVEMLPDVAALSGIDVEGVPVDRLLSTMNRRIELLMGRDYTLGHAYFMPLRADPSLEVLASIFRRQVLPLLQEYFFEDWQRIAWVLNDHRKPHPLQFVRQSDHDPEALLGADIELPRPGTVWEINPDAFGQVDAYRLILYADPATA